MRTTIRAAAALVTAAMALCAPALQAQNIHYGESFELNGTLVSSQDHEYYAGSYIDLNSGFHSEPNSGNWTWLQLDSEGYSINPPEAGYTNSSGYIVGSLGGTLNVGAMGGLVYTIPLEIPNGINGMQPNLSITYNSQAGNGLLGWGWNLTGLSSITRTGQTLYHDGEMTAADLTWNDRFLLDGKRLVKVADYTDSIEYRTEQDEMSRIMAYTHMEYYMGIIPIRVLDHFVVWKADGLIMEYGATADSWIEPENGGYHALCWLLNEVRDRNGNSIVYHYNENQTYGTYYIDLIEYTVNEVQNVPAQFSVTFNYSGNRQDSETCYIAGNQVQLKHLLTSITVSTKQGNRPLLEYVFSYTWDIKRLYYNLKKIRTKAYGENSQTEEVNATTVEWDASKAYRLVTSTITNPAIFGDFPFTGDFNGDGYTDVALVPYKDTTVYSSPVDVRIYLNDRNLGFEHNASMDLSLPATLDWIQVLDINGDGLDDLVPRFYDTVPSTGTESTTVLVYINNPVSQTFSMEGYKTIQSKGDVVVGDFNGDGNSDVILLEKEYDRVPVNPGIGWYENMPFVKNAFFIGYVNSTIQTTQLNNTPLVDLGPAYSIVPADFNGDGTTEVLLVGVNHDNTNYHGSKICGFDFTGNNGCVVLQDFSTFQPTYFYPFQRIGTEQPWCPVFAGDYNGDGKVDIIYYHYGVWRVCFSEGAFLGTPLEITGTGLPDLNYSVNFFYPSLNVVKDVSHSHMATCVASDFDGDGCTDLGYTYESSHAMYFAMRLKKTDSGRAQFRRQFYDNQTNVVFNCQFIHEGNYLGRDNTSFLHLVVPSKGDKSVAASILSLRPVSLYGSVTSITDGMGNKTTFTYDYLTPKPTGTADPFYSCNYVAPDANGVRPVPLPVRALRTCSVQGVNNSKAITKYGYHNAMCHKYGHGFMGFGTTTVETYHNSTDSLWTTRKVSYNESSTMGQYAMLLPYRETTFINDNGYSIPVNKTYYSFTNAKFASGLTDLVVCPAMTGKTEKVFSMDEDDEQIATVATSYQYNYNSNNHTYSNAYGCTTVTQTVTEYDSGSTVTELQTIKQMTPQTYVPTWIVNRPGGEAITRTRNNESLYSCTTYTYASNNTYQPETVTVLPNDGSQPYDPLTLTTTYQYDAFGNVTGTTVAAPYGTHGEVSRSVSYEYGSEYQHRLLTKETKGSPNNGYITQYGYDFHDRPATVTDCNGKHTASTTSTFGTDQNVTLPDGTEQRSLTLWADESTYKPSGASYYTWTKKTGGVTTMTFYHKSGAELRSVTFDFLGRAVFTDKQYNAKGLLESESAPYRMGEQAENIQWTVYGYDAHDRLSRVDYPDGSVKAVVYDGLETTTTVTPPQGSPVMTPQTTVGRTNVLGWLRESVDASGTSVFYEYYADGNLKWTRIGNDETTKISMEYDHAGNRTRLHDPDYCTAQKDLISVYNAFGEEVGRTTPRDCVSTFAYDEFGRMTGRSEVEPGTPGSKNTVWNYGETVPQKGLLMSVTYPGQTVGYAYDTCQRVVSDTVRFAGGGTYVTQYTYDRASRTSSVTHPSGFSVYYHYNSIGYQNIQRDSQGNELYKAQSTTPMGQMERFTLGGVLQSTLEYDPERHLLTRIKTQKNSSTVQNFTYTYDGFCNLATRKDNMRNLEETFEYDSQNRLKKEWLGVTQTGMSNYDSYGRMTAKTAGGQAVFSNAVYNTTAKPHAMDAATTATGVFPTTPQTVTYTGFDKVGKVKQGTDSICYTYGYDHQRICMEEHVGNTTRTKRYVGSCEYQTETTGNATSSRWLTYLSGPTGVYAVVVTENNTHTVHYVLKDNLGSWTTITNASGTVEQQLSYDAWGNLRNPTTWSGSFTGTPMFDRGFTGHEHLYNFGLINMNGRMYDPVMSSFLSADQYVQSPENAQGFNRYAYCMNNPLRYVDPSGWLAGGGNTGYFPNTTNTFDPYMFYGGHIPLEPRDICGVGVRTEVATALLATFMYGNKISVGGTVAFGDDGKICDIDITLRFNINQLNQSLPTEAKGKCVLMGLGSTMTYWLDSKGRNWADGTKQWLKKSQEYMEQTGNDFSDPKYLIDFIQWNDADNSFKSYEAAFIPLSEVPEAILDDYVVAACSELMRIADIQINSGEKGHFANVSRIKTYNGTIELEFIEPEGTNFMETFKSSSLFFYKTPAYLYNISFIKYKLKP